MNDEFYWCFTHDRVEQGRTCKALDRLGPYASPEEARRWRERHERRDESWEEEDERWEEGPEAADDDS